MPQANEAWQVDDFRSQEFCFLSDVLPSEGPFGDGSFEKNRGPGRQIQVSQEFLWSRINLVCSSLVSSSSAHSRPKVFSVQADQAGVHSLSGC